MSRLLLRGENLTSLGVQAGPGYPPNHVLILYGSNVVVQQVSDEVLMGQPRVDYKRIYNVVPDYATDEQAAEIFLQGWRRGRETTGGSYDDAGLGVGVLSDRTAILWGLIGREVEFMNWYNRHYPSTKLQFPPMIRKEAMP